MLTHYFAPRIGGVEKVVQKLAEHLSDHELVIITEKHEAHLKEKEKYNNWTTVYRIDYPHKKYIGLLYVWLWFFKNRQLVAAADVVHIHDMFIWYLPLRFLFPFKPVYMTYHGWEGKYPISFKSMLQKKLAYHLTTGNTCVGEHLAIHQGIKANVITYGAVDMPKKRMKKVENSFVYLGRLIDETGLHLVLKALLKLKNMHVEFYGDGLLRGECEEFGKVFGFVENPGAVLAKAEFCFAGGYLTTLEALANKCLVILCYQNKLKEDCFKLAPFAPYVVIESSPQKTIEKIEYYRKHRKEMKEVIERGYDWVQKQTWEKYTEENLALWKGQR